MIKTALLISAKEKQEVRFGISCSLMGSRNRCYSVICLLITFLIRFADSSALAAKRALFKYI
jgi:hypothetical protein